MYADRMKRVLPWLLPLAGAIAVMAVPLLRHATETRTHARVAMLVEELRAAQRVFRTGAGGYATELASLLDRCGGQAPALAADYLTRLEAEGYRLHLRAAVDAAPVGADCQQRPLTSDYYVGVEPRTVAAGARTFAARAEGSVFVYFDGVAPGEADMVSGLATPLEAVDRLVIP